MGFLAAYVDVILSCRTRCFYQKIGITSKRFKCSVRVYYNAKFSVMDISRTYDVFFVCQRDDAIIIKTLRKCSDLEEFRTLIHRLAWICHTRADIMSPVIILLHITSKNCASKHVNLVNGVVRRVKSNQDRGIAHHELNIDELKIISFTDCSFANNMDSTSQLGFIFLLSDEKNRSNVLHFSNYMSKIIVRSILGRATYAFADIFDALYMLRHSWE